MSGSDTAAAERERLREAVERGELTPGEMAQAWPSGDQGAPIVRQAASYVDELGDDEGEIVIRPCGRCAGEGCTQCDDTGVVYP